MIRSILCIIVLGTVLAIDAAGQHDHGSRSYGAATNFKDLSAPPLMKNIGTATIKITTKDPRAQLFFDQGLNLLHSFWDMEAYRAFREASRIDPNAPMAWWGIYNSLAQNPQEMADERAAALKKAVELLPTASDREQYYIRSIQLLAEPGKGRSAWISELEALISKYPDEVEAQLLLANSLASAPSSYLPDGRPRDGKMYGRAILQNLLRTHPEHAAVHHYWIHAAENGPRAVEALASAEKLEKMALNSGHMLHMPGHIYYRLGMYDRARTAFIASLDLDLRYMQENKIHPINNWNYTHNLDYLVANSAEQGRFKEAEKYAKMLAEIPSDDSRIRSTGLGYMLYGGDTALVRLRMRFGMWDSAIKEIEKAAAGDSLSAKYKAAMLAYLRGMSAVEKNAVAAAAINREALQKLSDEMAASRGSNASDWYFGHATRVAAVHVLDLTGSIASIRGDHDEAVKLLTEASIRERDLGYWEPPHYTRPVLESLGHALIRAKRYDEAAAAFEEILHLRPRSGFAFRGLVEVHKLSGNVKALAEARKNLVSAWKEADQEVAGSLE
ncbi:MAG: tetratricopeptide repeat protein [Chloracidobacterium sp.]|nr:tetratricopeptide repeat protein [Chloracidobacterium sp.]